MFLGFGSSLTVSFLRSGFGSSLSFLLSSFSGGAKAGMEPNGGLPPNNAARNPRGMHRVSAHAVEMSLYWCLFVALDDGQTKCGAGPFSGLQTASQRGAWQEAGPMLRVVPEGWAGCGEFHWRDQLDRHSPYQSGRCASNGGHSTQFRTGQGQAPGRRLSEYRCKHWHMRAHGVSQAARGCDTKVLSCKPASGTPATDPWGSYVRALRTAWNMLHRAEART
ncbi:polycomb group RING finger protein 5 [Platysternon megacephalum]|uniref:Polycomb group RING finger protein 5 n=1 Tax=Platysternon megacephalum TaxID=55544 RepID=A0A4D9EI64_9SAUR|nr:polycomb group RING finger protein 5 [Platysternon megacephalum]